VAEEHAKTQFEGILDGFRHSMDEISTIEHQQAKLTATGHAAQKRVAITVDARGSIIDTRFAADIADLDYDEIAAAVTRAARAAQDTPAAKQRRSSGRCATDRQSFPRSRIWCPGSPISIRTHRRTYRSRTSAPPDLMHRKTESVNRCREVGRPGWD
jgi:DNA-binding protein YbaB